MAKLSGRLRRYSEKCVSDRLDEDYAKAVQEAANIIENIEYPATNAERIRAMTDEELVEAVNAVCTEIMGEIRCSQYKRCYDCWLAWLKEEVKT